MKKKPTFEEINYALRPAKNIERKMLCEAFNRLSPFCTVKSYRYIGFGSTYFSDFILFHKALGISNMLSIEKFVKNKKRILFNKPYKCIKIEFDESKTVLPNLEWDIPTITWLDYDYKLNDDCLTDIHFFCANASVGSVLVITVDAEPGKYVSKRLEKFKKGISKGKIPSGLSDDSLGAWGLAEISRRIIINEISETIGFRNGTRPKGLKFKFQQIFNFYYTDSSRMLSICGVLFDEGHDGHFKACQFDNLEYYRPDEKPFIIDIPTLTYKEVRDLDSKLPTTDPSKLTTPVPTIDKQKYSNIYKYFPTFTESEV